MIFIIVYIFSSMIVINGQSNCSVQNPCGSYGYCYDGTDDKSHCDCKFWWEGDLCNRQSNSGKQVIILGCLVAVLIVTFYGLQIGRIIYKKIKKSTPKKKEISQNPKLINVAIEHAKRSTQFSSCLIFILMIIVAIGTLVAKWSLLKPIHEEIVKKYENNERIYFNTNSFCNILNFENFDVVTFPVACCIVIICIITTKRISLFRKTCYGYGAPPIPIDFISHSHRKLAVVIFAIIADELFSIAKEAVNGSSTTDDGILVKFCLRIFQVLIMGFRFYPILACIYINSIVSLICATIYAWLDYSFTIVTQGMCYSDYYPTYDNNQSDSSGIELKFSYYGTGSNLIAIQLCTDIPRYLCLAYVSIKLPVNLIKKIYQKRKKILSDEEKVSMTLTREENILLDISHPQSVEMLYLHNLFRPANQRPRSHALLARLIPKFIYEWRDDFRFSSRILCIYSSIFLLLFFVIIQSSVAIVPVLNAYQPIFQLLVDLLLGFVNSVIDETTSNNSTSNQVSFPVPLLVRPYLFAVAMTTTIIIIQLLVSLANIRRNLLQVFRGDDSEVPRRLQLDYVLYATGNLHFAGYFIGYFIWGFIIIAIFSSIFCICVEAFITYHSVKLLEKILKAIIPSILLVLFKLFLNKILAQYVFLQHYGDVLALNNRRLLMIFLYFNFFLDAFLGFISSIIRLIQSMIGGIFYMPRLDYSSVGRKLETLDSGFNAYCGFIHTECTHRHPIMLVFASHLYNQLKKGQYQLKHISSNDLPKQEEDVILARKSLRYIKKWKLAVFLIRNPTIVIFRKSFLRQLHIDEIHALNDRDNTQREISSYVRRMPATQPMLVSQIGSSHIIIQRF